MQCRVNHPKCDGVGTITLNNGSLARCACASIRKAEKHFLQHGGNVRHLKFPSQLNQTATVNLSPADSLRTVDSLKHYVKDLSRYIETRHKLFLAGHTGRGKSQYASTLMLCALLRDYTAKFVDMRTLRLELKGYRGDEQKQYLKSLAEANLLILDDVGVERTDDFMRQEIMSALDYIVRHHSGMLVVTMNNAAKKDKLMEYYENERFVDALLEQPFTSVGFISENWREFDDR